MTHHTAIRILTEFAHSRVKTLPAQEQIEIYIALAELSDSEDERAIANELAAALSRAAALQMEFQIASSRNPRKHNHRRKRNGDGQRRKGDGK
jgi:hypothetical protein